MSTDTSAARPRQVLMPCRVVAIGSVVALVEILSLVASLGSVEIREQLTDLASEQAVSDLGLSVEDLRVVLQVLLHAGAVLCVSGVVLAWFVAQRHRGARVALTVQCAVVAVVFVALGVAGVLPALVAAWCAAQLWSSPARQWFSRRPAAVAALPPPAVREPAAPGGPHGHGAAVDGGREAADGAPATPGPAPAPDPAPGPRAASRPFAASPTDPAAPPPAPPAAAPPADWGPPPSAPPRATDRRPPTVLGAVLTASIMSGLAAGLLLVLGLAYLTSTDDLLPVMRDAGVTDSLVEPLGLSLREYVVLAGRVSLVLAALAAVGLGVSLWALSGTPAARTGLLVVCALGIVGCVAALPFLSLLAVVWVPGPVVVIVLLGRADVRRWYAEHGGRAGRSDGAAPPPRP